MDYSNTCKKWEVYLSKLGLIMISKDVSETGCTATVIGIVDKKRFTSVIPRYPGQTWVRLSNKDYDNEWITKGEFHE